METYIKTRREELVAALHDAVYRKHEALQVIDQSEKVIEAAKTALNELNRAEKEFKKQQDMPPEEEQQDMPPEEDIQTPPKQ